MRVALIDGDTLIFAATAFTEQVIQWDEYMWSRHAFLEDGIARFDADLQRIVERLDVDRAIIALSCSGPRFRADVMHTYKHNRTGSHKPVTYGPLRDYVKETQEVFERPRLEGDDVLGILATNPNAVKADEKIIVSIDKDLKQIPGKLYNYDHDTLVDISEEEADRFFYLQCLMGDKTDGYDGCPGIGPKKAEKILDDTEGDPWPAIVATYKKAGLSEEVALMNAQVARICRHTDYDYDNREVILWTP